MDTKNLGNVDEIIKAAQKPLLKTNQELKTMLGQSIANNAKANLNIQELKQMNANLVKQFAQLQVKNKEE